MAKKKSGYVRGSGKTGRVNMRRVEGGWMNQHGVVFTDAERRAMKKATAASNAKRAAEIAAWSEQPHMVGGRQMAPDKSQLRLMGKETEFIVARQHGDFQRFKTPEDFAKYMKKQERIVSGEYERDKIRLYKRNFTQSLLNTYGDAAKDIAMKVRMMKPEEYMRMVANDERLEIRYVPSDVKVDGRLDELRQALGMKLKDEDFYDDEDYY